MVQLVTDRRVSLDDISFEMRRLLDNTSNRFPDNPHWSEFVEERFRTILHLLTLALGEGWRAQPLGVLTLEDARNAFTLKLAPMHFPPPENLVREFEGRREEVFKQIQADKNLSFEELAKLSPETILSEKAAALLEEQVEISKRIYRISVL